MRINNVIIKEDKLLIFYENDETTIMGGVFTISYEEHPEKGPCIKTDEYTLRISSNKVDIIKRIARLIHFQGFERINISFHCQINDFASICSKNAEEYIRKQSKTFRFMNRRREIIDVFINDFIHINPDVYTVMIGDHILKDARIVVYPGYIQLFTEEDIDDDIVNIDLTRIDGALHSYFINVKDLTLINLTIKYGGSVDESVPSLDSEIREDELFILNEDLTITCPNEEN